MSSLQILIEKVILYRPRLLSQYYADELIRKETSLQKYQRKFRAYSSYLLTVWCCYKKENGDSNVTVLLVA